MINTFKSAIKIILVSLVILFSGYVALAAWSEPSTAPTGGNVSAPLDVSSTGQTKVGGLILNTGAAANGLIVSAGNVGIGTASPTDTLAFGNALDVNGTAGSCVYSRYNGSAVHFAAMCQDSLSSYFYSKDTSVFYTGGTQKMTILSGGNVGIGTNNPGSKLEVYGDLNLSNAGSVLLNGITSISRSPSTGSMTLATNAGDIILSPSGKVGIGTTAPGTKLEIGGIPDSDFLTFSQTSSYKHTLSSYMSATAGVSYLSFNINNGTGAITNNVLTLKGGGNVGIGTAAPVYALDISSPTANATRVWLHPSTGTDYGLLQISNTGGSSYYGMDNSTGAGLGSGSAYALTMYAPNVPIVFMTNGTEKMRIQAAGNVGIGTNNPAQKLSVAGTIESTTGGFKFPDGTTQISAATPSGGAMSASNVTLSGDPTGCGGNICPAANTLYKGNTVKAWCIFSGTTTGSFSCSAGFGVTGISRASAGSYVYNLYSAFTSTNYAVVGTCTGGALTIFTVNPSVTYAGTIGCVTPGGVYTDATTVSFIVMGNQ